MTYVRRKSPYAKAAYGAPGLSREGLASERNVFIANLLLTLLADFFQKVTQRFINL
jgi:hypothetical protein